MKRFLWLVAAFLVAASASAHPGVGIVRDSRGNIYYTDLKHVWKIAADGTKSIAVPNVHTHELCLDAADNLYGEHLWYEGEATDKWGHYVWRLSPLGELAQIIPPQEGFRKNYSFVRDRAGNMYWVEGGQPPLLKRRTPDGRISALRGEIGLSNVRWMTATPEGTVYLIDDPDLVRITPDGVVTRVARNLKERSWFQFFVGDHHTLMGLWTDPQGNVYVAVYGARLVKKVSPRGTISAVARSPIPWSPTGGLVAPDGALWLLEYAITGAARVRRLGPDGSERVF